MWWVTHSSCGQGGKTIMAWGVGGRGVRDDFFFFQNVLKYLSSFSTNTGRQLKHKTSPLRQRVGNMKQ